MWRFMALTMVSIFKLLAIGFCVPALVTAGVHFHRNRCHSSSFPAHPVSKRDQVPSFDIVRSCRAGSDNSPSTSELRPFGSSRFSPKPQQSHFSLLLT